MWRVLLFHSFTMIVDQKNSFFFKSLEVVALNIEETMSTLTRCSFDETLRQPIYMFGGIRAIAELIQVH